MDGKTPRKGKIYLAKFNISLSDILEKISKKANSMKNSASPEELIKFCKNILRYSLNTTETECSEQEDKEPLG